MKLNKPAQTPMANSVETVCEAHGNRWVDHYAWLRADNWQEALSEPEKLPSHIAQYLKSENQYYEQATAELEPLRKTLIAEMRGRIEQKEDSVRLPHGPYHYYDRYTEGAEHELYVRSRLDGSDEEILIDENKEAERFEYFEIGAMYQSPDHSMLLWTVDTNGSEFYTLFIRDLASGKDKDYCIEKVDSVTWANNKTLFYSRLDEFHRARKIYRHTVDTDPSQDKLVFEEMDERFYCGVDTSLSGEYVFIHTSMNDQDEVWYIPTKNLDSAPALIQARTQGLEYEVDHQGDRFIITTNADGATDFKIVETPLTATSKDHWKDLVPHREGFLIEDLVVFKHWIVWQELVNALPQISYFDNTGKIHSLNFQEQAYALGLYSGYEYDTALLVYTYSSPTTPTQTFCVNLQSQQRELLKQQGIPSGHNSDDYITQRLTVPSHDGEQVPVTLLYHKNTSLDGTAPALLHGYGSYGYSIEANFRHERLVLADRGFVLAVAHVRGGQEKGRNWYENAKFEHKPNSFKDFNAVGEALIDQGFCAANKLVSVGGSAGGLLVAASMDLNPELFAGVIAHVPFVDVLNTMLDDTLPGTPGEFTQWGNPIESSAAFDTIRGYTPYENVKARHYPALYVTAGVSDPRVTYWEPAKWVAKLRANKTDDNIVLLKTNMSSGHFGKTGRFASLDDDAHAYAFAIAITS